MNITRKVLLTASIIAVAWAGSAFAASKGGAPTTAPGHAGATPDSAPGRLQTTPGQTPGTPPPGQATTPGTPGLSGPGQGLIQRKK
jgi:hypothetical protein